MNRLQTQTNQKHGRVAGAFTLIELLVVVAILALLVGMVLPALSSSRETARSVTCSMRMAQAGAVLQVYQSDNRDIFPRLQDPSYGVATPAFDPGVVLDKTWVDVLSVQGYFQSVIAQVGVPVELRCPSAVNYDNDPSWGGHMPQIGANFFLNPPPSMMSRIGDRSFFGRALAYAGDPSKKIMLVDSRHLTHDRGWFGAGAASWVGFRHANGSAANAVYLDGHVALQRNEKGVPTTSTEHPFNSAHFARQ